MKTVSHLESRSQQLLDRNGLGRIEVLSQGDFDIE
jgi:hypothetical protein